MQAEDLKNIQVAIIGAGPSGCVAAAYLEKHGYRVAVFEKGHFPRFVIGESLIPRCMDHFAEVDLLDCLKEQGFERKDGARFIRDGLHCDFDFSKQYGDGRSWTWQVPRADFDHTLTQELEKRGVPISFGTEILDVQFDENGGSVLSFKDKDGITGEVKAEFVIDSSGYGRVLPRLLGLDMPSVLPSHSSAFVHVKDQDRPAGKEGSLITFDVLSRSTWLWVIPFSNGTTSIGFVGPTEWIESFYRHEAREYGRDDAVVRSL